MDVFSKPILKSFPSTPPPRREVKKRPALPFEANPSAQVQCLHLAGLTRDSGDSPAPAPPTTTAQTPSTREHRVSWCDGQANHLELTAPGSPLNPGPGVGDYGWTGRETTWGPVNLTARLAPAQLGRLAPQTRFPGHLRVVWQYPPG